MSQRSWIGVDCARSCLIDARFGHLGRAYPVLGCIRAILSRLYAAATMYAASCLLTMPTKRLFLNPPMDFIQPKISSIRLRFLWLTA